MAKHKKMGGNASLSESSRDDATACAAGLSCSKELSYSKELSCSKWPSKPLGPPFTVAFEAAGNACL